MSTGWTPLADGPATPKPPNKPVVTAWRAVGCGCGGVIAFYVLILVTMGWSWLGDPDGMPTLLSNAGDEGPVTEAPEPMRDGWLVRTPVESFPLLREPDGAAEPGVIERPSAGRPDARQRDRIARLVELGVLAAERTEDSATVGDALVRQGVAARLADGAGAGVHLATWASLANEPLASTRWWAVPPDDVVPLVRVHAWWDQMQYWVHVRAIDDGVDVPGLIGFFNGVARKLDSEHRAAWLPADPTTVVVLPAADLEALFDADAADPFAGDAPDLTLPPGADLDRAEIERLVREALQQAESPPEGAPPADPSE